MAEEKHRPQVSVGLTITQNLGDYESAKIHAGFQTDVLPNQTPEQAYDEAWRLVSEEVASRMEKFAQIKKNR